MVIPIHHYEWKRRPPGILPKDRRPLPYSSKILSRRISGDAAAHRSSAAITLRLASDRQGADAAVSVNAEVVEPPEVTVAAAGMVGLVVKDTPDGAVKLTV